MKNQSQQVTSEASTREIVDPRFIQGLVALRRSQQRSCYVREPDGTVTFINNKIKPDMRTLG